MCFGANKKLFINFVTTNNLLTKNNDTNRLNVVFMNKSMVTSENFKENINGYND